MLPLRPLGGVPGGLPTPVLAFPCSMLANNLQRLHIFTDVLTHMHSVIQLQPFPQDETLVHLFCSATKNTACRACT